MAAGTTAPEIQVGYASAQGQRPANEDFVGYCIAEGSDAARRGHVVAIADGMSTAKGGRMAAEMAVHSLLDGFYSLPETHGPQRNASRAIETINSWIHRQGRGDPQLEGAATTLTTIVLHGRTAHILHVGDARAFHLSGGRIIQLTEDHTHRPGDLNRVLYRAVGLEAAVRVDHVAIPVRVQDRFLLCSDGVHSVVSTARLAMLLARRGAPAEDAQLIVDAAREAGSIDNSTAVIVDVVALPSASPDELSKMITQLPIAALPAIGTTVDGMYIEDQVSDSRRTAVYAAVDRRSGRKLAVKFPKPAVASERTYVLAFIRQMWIASNVRSPYVAACIDDSPDRRSCLYTAMPFYEGETLEQRLSGSALISLNEGLRIGLGLVRGAAALHRAGIVHRNIKPAKILLEHNGGLKLLDLSFARLPWLEEFSADELPSTPAFMAPELFRGQTANEASDQFAIGVTLFRMFSRRYPYGEIKALQQPRFGTPASLIEYRPDLPVWVDDFVRRAVSADPKKRFADVLELGAELERAAAHGSFAKPARVSLYERNPLLFWKVVSFALLLGLIWSLAR